MLIHGSRLLGTPVMSLQTGGRLAQTAEPIIDPASLRIIAYQLEGPLLAENPSFLRTDDIREIGAMGMIIDSTDELVGVNDVIQIQKLTSLRFRLVGLRVKDQDGRKLGKVEDYTLETGAFVIQQLSVRRGVLQALTDTGFLVNRSQIVEINDNEIIIRSGKVKQAEPVMTQKRTEFVNPFRQQTPPIESSRS